MRDLERDLFRQFASGSSTHSRTSADKAQDTPIPTKLVSQPGQPVSPPMNINTGI